MKKTWNIIIKIIAIITVALSGYLMLTSDVQLKISDTHAMVKQVVREIVSDSEDQSLRYATQFLEASGLEDDLLQAFPKKYNLDLSYADLYRLSTKYDETGKITPSDLNLENSNRLEEVVNKFIVKEINQKLKDDSKQVYHIISIYRYSIFIIVLLYILGALLIIFGKYWASIPIIIATGGSFGLLWYFNTEATSSLQTIYQGIFIDISSGIWIGLILGIVIAIMWPIWLKFNSDKKVK